MVRINLDISGVADANEDTQSAHIRVNTDDEPATPEGKLPSSWVVLARDAEDLGALREDSRWQPLPPAPGMRLWTDDYSNILSVFDWH